MHTVRPVVLNLWYERPLQFSSVCVCACVRVRVRVRVRARACVCVCYNFYRIGSFINTSLDIDFDLTMTSCDQNREIA